MVKEERIRGVVSMNEDYELALFSHQSQGWKKLGVDFLQLSTVDIFQVRIQTTVYLIHCIGPVRYKNFGSIGPGERSKHFLLIRLLRKQQQGTPNKTFPPQNVPATNIHNILN